MGSNGENDLECAKMNNKKNVQMMQASISEVAGKGHWICTKAHKSIMTENYWAPSLVGPHVKRSLFSLLLKKIHITSLNFCENSLFLPEL
jgi:hypothetical protein